MGIKPHLRRFMDRMRTNFAERFASQGAASHSHPQADISNLVSALAGKAASSHTHAQSDITSLDTALAGKWGKTEIVAYSGTTDSNGNYTVEFDPDYAQAPTVIATLAPSTAIGQKARVTAVSAAGFTVHVGLQDSVNVPLISLTVALPTYTNVNGAAVRALVIPP